MNKENANQYFFIIIISILFITALTKLSIIELTPHIVLDVIFIVPFLLAIYTRRYYVLWGGFAWAITISLTGVTEFGNFYSLSPIMVSIIIRMITASAFYTAVNTKLTDKTLSVKRAIKFGLVSGLIIYFFLMLAGYTLTHSQQWLSSNIKYIVLNKFLIEAIFGVICYWGVDKHLKVCVLDTDDIRPNFLLDTAELNENEVLIVTQSLNLKRYETVLNELNLYYLHDSVGVITITDISEWILLIKEISVPLTIWENEDNTVQILIIDVEDKFICDYFKRG